MFDLLMFISAFTTIKDMIKEHKEEKLSTACMSDFRKYRDDVLNGVSQEQRTDKMCAGIYQRNIQSPHKDINHNIIVDDSQAFENDKAIYGSVAYEWAREGKYNLSDEAMITEKQRIDDKYSLLYSLIRRDKRNKN